MPTSAKRAMLLIMGIFGSRKKTVVRVLSGHPAYPPPSVGSRSRFQRYTYRWDLNVDPTLGMWVVLPGDSGQWLGAVVGIDRTDRTASLKAVIRAATDRDISRDIKRRGDR